jgi:hypothetical protein
LKYALRRSHAFAGRSSASEDRHDATQLIEQIQKNSHAVPWYGLTTRVSFDDGGFWGNDKGREKRPTNREIAVYPLLTYLPSTYNIFTSAACDVMTETRARGKNAVPPVEPAQYVPENVSHFAIARVGPGGLPNAVHREAVEARKRQRRNPGKWQRRLRDWRADMGFCPQRCPRRVPFSDRRAGMRARTPLADYPRVMSLRLPERANVARPISSPVSRSRISAETC